MFTGIIETLGIIKDIQREGDNLHVSVSSSITSELKIDQSLAHNGICLTVVAIKNDIYTVTAIKETIEDAGLSIEDINKILIHQANAKMDYAMIERLHKLYNVKDYDHSISPMTIQEFGNSSVATIPTMFDLIIKGKMEGQSFKEKGNIVMTSVGAGMNINAIVYRFP